MSSVPAHKPASSTHFDVLSLPVRYALDAEELESRYREASRHWHPDRFARAPVSERAAVLQRATDLNQAYRVLKSDERRAEYLLKLRGVDLTSEESGKQPAMDPEFLGEVLELREELVEARAARSKDRVHAVKKSVEDRVDRHRAALAAGFTKLEAGDASLIAPLTKIVLEQRYHRRFLDEIAALEDALSELPEAASAT